MSFLYQKAQEAARYARRVFNGYYKKGTPEVGVTIEPQARVKIELGYVRKWKVEGVERQEFHTSKHLNMALEAHAAKQLEAIAEQAVIDLEQKAQEMTLGSIEVVRSELQRIEAYAAEQGVGPEVA